MNTLPRAILFDLDGTLLDSAPDLAQAVQLMRRTRQLPELPYAALRPHAGSGARGMLGAGLGIKPADESFDALREEFLSIYERVMLERTKPFDGVAGVLAALRQRGMAWGIVTNKFARFTLPIVANFDCLTDAGAVIAGDTTGHAKPHPEPLLEAARRLRVAPAECMYVGDDVRDVEAGRAAGMTTVAASYGYLG